MKTTKRQLRRIIKESMGIDRKRIDSVMKSLADGDVDSAAQSIMDSFWMDDTWAKEEEALESMLASLGTNPTVDEVNATAIQWLDGYRAGDFRPSEEEYEDDWSRQSQRSKSRREKTLSNYQMESIDKMRITKRQLRRIIKEEIGYQQKMTYERGAPMPSPGEASMRLSDVLQDIRKTAADDRVAKLGAEAEVLLTIIERGPDDRIAKMTWDEWVGNDPNLYQDE